MRIDRAAKFGFVASIGVTAISWATFLMIRMVWANRISGFEGKAIATILVVVAGTAVILMFLFAVIGVFVDRKLEARGLASLEE